MKRIFYPLIILVLCLGEAYSLTGVIEIQPGASEVEFSAIGNPSMLTIEGEGNQLQGRFHFLSETKIEGQAEFDLKSLKTGIDLRDQHMKNKYLEVGKENGSYAKAQLRLNRLNLPQGKNFKVDNIPFEGVLKLHGVERTIQGKVEAERAGNDFKAKVKFDLKLKDFGIETPSYADITVGEEVKVVVNVVGSAQGTK